MAEVLFRPLPPAEPNLILLGDCNFTEDATTITLDKIRLYCTENLKRGKVSNQSANLLQIVSQLLNSTDVTAAQSADPSLSNIGMYATKGMSRINKWSWFYQVSGKMYREVTSNHGETSTQFVVPVQYREAVMQTGYCAASYHMGRQRTHNRINHKFSGPIWSQMSRGSLGHMVHARWLQQRLAWSQCTYNYYLPLLLHIVT